MKYGSIGIPFMIILLVGGQAAYAASCPIPVSYSVSVIDSRFNTSQDDLVQDLARAKAIWEMPAGRDLFAYATSGGSVSVNLTYDSRQATTDANKATLAKLDTIEAGYHALRAVFDAQASSTEDQEASSLDDSAAYKKDQEQYNADVAASKARGGASPEEYQAFADRKAALQARLTAIQAQQDAINTRVARVNALGTLFDQLAGAINGYIKSYNAALTGMREYEEGVYMRDGSSQSITIYEFTSTDDLVRVLAHEMGHALGLDHVIDPNAIMYKNNQGTSLSTTPTDMRELKSVCGF